MEEFDEDVCMMNSYLLITGKKSIEQFMLEEDVLYFIFNPHKSTVTKEIKVYDCLIDYFISTEEYEKCSELVELKKVNQLISSTDVI